MRNEDPEQGKRTWNKERGSGTRNEDPERGTTIRNEERRSGTRNDDQERGAKHPMTLYKWCNDMWGTRTHHVCTWGDE